MQIVVDSCFYVLLVLQKVFAQSNERGVFLNRLNGGALANPLPRFRATGSARGFAFQQFYAICATSRNNRKSTLGLSSALVGCWVSGSGITGASFRCLPRFISALRQRRGRSSRDIFQLLC